MQRNGDTSSTQQIHAAFKAQDVQLDQLHDTHARLKVVTDDIANEFTEQGKVIAKLVKHVDTTTVNTRQCEKRRNKLEPSIPRPWCTIS